MTQEKKIIRRLSAVGIYGNVLLTGFKLYAGIAGGSGAMVSDAVHSLSDVLATAIAGIGAGLGRKEPDKEHPYGHNKFEALASAVLGTVLAVTGVGIGVSAVKAFLHPADYAGQAGSALPIVAAAVSIVCKEAMYRYTIHYANRMDSQVFRADAWHHRSDALSSVGSLAGILGARFGLTWTEPAASAVICAFIVKIGAGILLDALRTLLDSSCGEAFEKRVSDCVLSVDGVRGIDLMRTRRFGNKAYADLEISVDRTLSLVEAHEIAERVHATVETEIPGIRHIMIHVNPEGERHEE